MSAIPTPNLSEPSKTSWRSYPVSERMRMARCQRIKAHPPNLLTLAGMAADPWQAQTLLDRTTARLLLLCSRQAGKSTVAAALALREAILSPPALVLLLSPTLRQSGELFRDKVLRLYNALGRPVLPARLTATELELTNGSRIVSLPENEETVRGFSSVSLLIIDEAARVSDDLYRAVRPMLAVSGGKLVCLSTPFGKRGFFHDAWQDGGSAWKRVEVHAEDTPRITPEFLAEERLALGSAWFAQEYLCSFESMQGALFQRQWFGLVDAAPADLTLVRRWDFAGSKPKPGRDPDHTAGVLVGRSVAGRYYVLDVRRTRDTAGGVEALVKQTAELDGRGVPVRLEQEPGSAGLFVVDQFVRVVLPGWDCRGVPSTGDKAARARPLAAQAEAGNVYLVRGPWNKELLDELEVFPLGSHDDQVDALSGAFADLVLPLGTVTGSVGARQIDSLPPGTFATPGSFHRMPPGTFRS
jgi:predicted phage terminase large subunit-like protein